MAIYIIKFFIKENIMIKKILIIISVSMLALACKSNTGSSGKPVTKNIPSVNHTEKQGSLSLNASKTALFSMTASASSASTNSASEIPTITPAVDTQKNDNQAKDQREYSVLTRLYSTVWFQTEEEQDNGKVETESTFLYFNKDSKVEERELETGEPDESEYSTVEIVEGIGLVTVKITAIQTEIETLALLKIRSLVITTANINYITLKTKILYM